MGLSEQSVLLCELYAYGALMKVGNAGKGLVDYYVS